jgi:RNA polymerase sigma-70 factor (ECF subfamily)
MGSIKDIGPLTTEELFRRHAGFVARFLARLGVPKEQLEDALQEVFLVVHRNGGYRPGLASPTSYLANIAIRAAQHQRRRQGVARQRHSEAPVERMPDEIEDPARTLQMRQDLERLRQALARLPEDLSTVLVLVELEGESCVSVAAGLGCPVGTVYWRLHQARKELQSALRLVDAPRRSARPAPEPDTRAQPARSFMLIFGLDGFRSSEASRLLQLAREQPPPAIAVDELLGRHQQLVQSGAQLPAWASGLTPHAASWLTLLGVGPIAGATAGAAILAAVLVTQYRTPPPAEPHHPSAARGIVAVDAPSRPIATVAAEVQEAETPTTAQPAAPSGTPAVKVARERQPRAAQLRTQSALPSPSASAPASTSLVAVDAHADSTRDPADTAAAAAPAPTPRASDRRAEANATPAMEAAPRAPPKQNRPAPDRELAEMREIARAERLLAQDPQAALALTRSLQVGFPDGYFREERAYLEVMALHELGRTAEMRDKAAAFLRDYPAGLYSGRVRKAAASEAK